MNVMINLMIAFSLQAALSPSIDQSLMAEISVAAERLDSCVEASVAKFISSTEPADVVASVAMWECQGRSTDVLDASVKFIQASRPYADPQTVREELAADHPAYIASRTQRAIYYVVTQRLGMSWHMPIEEYNSRRK